MGTRCPLIAGNWKMFKTGSEAKETASRLAELTAGAKDRDVMIAPPYTSLALVAEAVRGSIIEVGAQDLYWEDEGAYTGEISSKMITSAGCRYAIILPV